MSTNGNRLDRIEKARHNDVARGIGSCYACITSCLDEPFVGAVGRPNYALEHRGKIIVDEDGQPRWAGDQDHPDARYPESKPEFILASINALEPRFGADEIRRTFDLIVAELTSDNER